MKVKRRTFLELTAGGAVGLVAGCGQVTPDSEASPLEIPSHPERFPFGVQASDVDGTSARIMFRADADTVAIRLGDDVIAAEPNADGFVIVDVEGLSPGVEYEYAGLVIDDSGDPVAQSVIGRFRTLPAPDFAGPLTFGASACTHGNWAPWSSLSHLAKRKTDLHLMLGDACYADRAEDLAAYRAQWASSYSSDSYKDLRASTGIYATWDDHEVANNWVHHPEDDPPQESGRNRRTLVGPARFAAARQAFIEHGGVRGDRIWRAFRWGDTAEFFILDCRGERVVSENPRDVRYLSREQMDWLKAGLSASTSHWKFIVNSVPIVSIPEINAMLQDGWMGHPDARAEILDHVDGNVAGVVWLSADYHAFAVARVSPVADEHPGQYDVLIGHGGSIANPVIEAIAGNDTEGRFLGASTAPGVVLFTASPPGGDDVLDVTYIGNDGEALNEVSLPYPSL